MLPVSGLVIFTDRSPSEIGRNAFVLVIFWMAVTAVIAKPEQRLLTLARNLSVVSFWIAVTLAFVMAADLILNDPFDLPPRLLSVGLLLIFAIPLHTFRILPPRQALPMTVALWVSMGILAWRVMR